MGLCLGIQELNVACDGNLHQRIADLDNTFEKFDFNELDFNDVEDRIYQYQQLLKFFDVDPDKLSEKYEEVEEEINQLQNFDKEKNKKYSHLKL